MKYGNSHVYIRFSCTQNCEDRHILFSFQHGQRGVLYFKQDGKPLTNIYRLQGLTALLRRTL